MVLIYGACASSGRIRKCNLPICLRTPPRPAAQVTSGEHCGKPHNQHKDDAEGAGAEDAASESSCADQEMAELFGDDGEGAGADGEEAAAPEPAAEAPQPAAEGPPAMMAGQGVAGSSIRLPFSHGYLCFYEGSQTFVAE